MSVIGVSQESRQKVYEMANCRCENPKCRIPVLYGEFEWHHRYWRSQYNKADRHQYRNGACLCKKCHDSIHNSGHVKLDRYLKLEADRRLSPDKRSEEKDPLLGALAKQRKKYRQRRKEQETQEQSDYILKRKEKEKVRNRELAKKQRQQQIEQYKEKNGGLTPSQVAYRSKKQYSKGLKN